MNRSSHSFILMVIPTKLASVFNCDDIFCAVLLYVPANNLSLHDILLAPNLINNSNLSLQASFLFRIRKKNNNNSLYFLWFLFKCMTMGFWWKFSGRLRKRFYLHTTHTNEWIFTHLYIDKLLFVYLYIIPKHMYTSLHMSIHRSSVWK